MAEDIQQERKYIYVGRGTRELRDGPDAAHHLGIYDGPRRAGTRIMISTLAVDRNQSTKLVSSACDHD